MAALSVISTSSSSQVVLTGVDSVDGDRDFLLDETCGVSLRWMRLSLLVKAPSGVSFSSPSSTALKEIL